MQSNSEVNQDNNQTAQHGNANAKQLEWKCAVHITTDGIVTVFCENGDVHSGCAPGLLKQILLHYYAGYVKGVVNESEHPVCSKKL